jgi:hypothetical protein
MDRQELIAQGVALRDEGRERAARWREYQIKAGQLAFLRALLRSPDRTATVDDATEEPDLPFKDGGKWRGSIPKALGGLIEQAGVVRSSRPSRHAGYVTLWRGTDDAGIELKCVELEAWLADNADLADEAE